MEQQQYSEERKKVETWVAANFAFSTIPPFSFTYGGRLSSEFLKDWQFSQETKQLDDTRMERIEAYTDLSTGLVVRCACTVFSDFPAVEWVVTFKNGGKESTPIIEDVQALDTLFTRKEKGEFILHRALGSSATRMDFAPIDEVMRPNAKIQLAPIGGRSSNTTAFPFFNIEAPGEGVVVAVGWSGQWAASLSRDGGTGLTVRAGMELTHLKLHPGEEIRTPRILLLFWQGDDRLRGHNLLRRFILAHHTLKKDGKPVTVPFAACGFSQFDTGNSVTEQNQIAFAERYAQLGIELEYFWLDAGWFEGGWSNGVGNWFPKKDAFPNGLKALSDAVEKMGMGFIVWFEPERVYQGTWLDREQPEWVLKLPGNPNRLLNLGNPEALRWLTNHTSGMIENDGISVYRQDFNMEPLPYWRAADTPDRQGMTEIRHIEGLYAFWDELLARHPRLIIDNCASGGRRIDLETTSRSIPLWRSDYVSESTGSQCHTYGLNLYLPCSGTGSYHPEPYDFRSVLSGGVNLNWDPRPADFPAEQARRLISEFKRLRTFFYGDFYPLTSHSVSNGTWIAYQFHREDIGQGMFLAFRRPESPYLSARLSLGGLKHEARYELNFEDAGIKLTETGEALAAGINVTIEDAPGSLLVTYRQLIF